MNLHHACIETTFIRFSGFFFEGLKVTGGKMTPSRYRGAFITKVQRGSIADTAGHLRAGMLT